MKDAVSATKRASGETEGRRSRADSDADKKSDDAGGGVPEEKNGEKEGGT